MGLSIFDHMNEAWDDMKNETTSKNMQYVLNLLSHSYNAADKFYIDYCKRSGKKYNNDIFYCFQEIMIFLALCDDHFYQTEYDCYCNFCNWARVEPLSVSDCKALYNRYSIDHLTDKIALLVAIRSYMGEDNYASLVRAFCHYSLLSDNKLDEEEYYIISGFYTGKYDDYGGGWENFKRRW
jgi:hypothetical protein